MPELPEVQIISEGLKARLLGRRIDRVEVYLPKLIQGDVDEFKAGLIGLTVRDISRKGKILLWDLGQRLLGVHLKMTGRFSFCPPEAPLLKHTHLRLGLAETPYEARFQDLRQFGWFRLLRPEELAAWPAWNELGPDALNLDEEEFRRLLARRRGRIKSLLLNQAFLAGLGNIYADESLHRAGLHPLRLAEDLSPEERRALHEAVGRVLALALAAGGSSVVNFRDCEGNLGHFQMEHRVYGRQGQACLTCGAAVDRLKIGGRSSFFCPVCQPLNGPAPRDGS